MCTITDEVAVTVYRSDRDGVPVVEIDTQEGGGVVRINLNDGNIWDGDPEQDVPEMLDGFEIAHTWDGREYMFCLDCIDEIPVGDEGTLRAYVAAAKAHTANCRKVKRG